MRMVAFLLALGAVLGGFMSEKAEAAVVTQSRSFSDSQTALGTGRIVHAGPAGLSDSFEPFDSSFGTLNSFTVAWTVTISASGVAGSTGGGFSVQIGGSFYVDSGVYSGAGTGNGNGNGPNSPISAVSSTVTSSSTLLPSNAGVTYNPAILASITGSVPFSLTYKNYPTDTVYTDYNGLASLSSSVTASVTLTYDYTAPTTVPEPASLWICASLLTGVVVLRRFRQRA